MVCVMLDIGSILLENYLQLDKLIWSANQIIFKQLQTPNPILKKNLRNTSSSGTVGFN